MTARDPMVAKQWKILLESTEKAGYRTLSSVLKALDTSPLYKVSVGITQRDTPVRYGEARGTFHRGDSHINLNVSGTEWNTCEDTAVTLMHEALHAYFEGRRAGKLNPHRRWKATAREEDNPSVEIFREEMVVNYIAYYYKGLRGKDLNDIMDKVAASYAAPFKLNAKKEVEIFFRDGCKSSVFEEGLEIFEDMAKRPFDGT